MSDIDKLELVRAHLSVPGKWTIHNDVITTSFEAEVQEGPMERYREMHANVTDNPGAGYDIPTSTTHDLLKSEGQGFINSIRNLSVSKGLLNDSNDIQIAFPEPIEIGEDNIAAGTLSIPLSAINAELPPQTPLSHINQRPFRDQDGERAIREIVSIAAGPYVGQTRDLTFVGSDTDQMTRAKEAVSNAILESGALALGQFEVVVSGRLVDVQENKDENGEEKNMQETRRAITYSSHVKIYGEVDTDAAYRYVNRKNQEAETRRNEFRARVRAQQSLASRETPETPEK